MISSLGSKTLRAATLCVVLLFMPTASCGWLDQKPTAQNQALISATALVLAPVLDGVLRNAGSLGSLDGWKKLPKALKNHISQSLFAEGIKSREKDEGFFAHKARVAGTYAMENPVFLVALALVVANASHSLWTEFDRLAKNQNPDAAKLAQAQKDLTAKLNAATTRGDLATSEKDDLARQLATAREAQNAAEAALRVLREEHSRCAAPGDVEAQFRALTAEHARCPGVLEATQTQLAGAARDLAAAVGEHRDCADTHRALETQIRELTSALESATKAKLGSDGDDAGDGTDSKLPPGGAHAVTDHLNGAAAFAAMRGAANSRGPAIQPAGAVKPPRPGDADPADGQQGDDEE